jgi:predicted MFS family arabinose efflux permease
MAPMTPRIPLALLSAAAFVSAGSMRMIDPVLHLIATDFGTSVAGAAWLVAAFALPYGLMQVFYGPVGDRFGKLPVLGGALVAFALLGSACALAGSLRGLEVLRGLSGAAAAGIIPVCLAYIGDHTPYDQRQATIAKFLTGIVLAQVLAAPLGGIVGEALGWRPLFLIMGAAALVVAILLWRARATAPERPGGSGKLSLTPYLTVLRRPAGRFIAIAALADGASLFGPTPFLGAHLHETFGLSYAEVGLVLALVGVGGFTYTRAAPRLLARLGERGLVTVGGIAITLAFALIGVVPHWAGAALLIAVLGLAFFMLHGTMQVRATEAAPDARTTAVALFASMLFLGQALGALAIGALVGAFGYPVGFAVSAGAVLGLTLWLRWRFGLAPPQRKPG